MQGDEIIGKAYYEALGGAVQDIKIFAEADCMPVLGSEHAAGYDLKAAEHVVLQPGETRAISLGFAAALPDDIHARIESRSGLALKGVVVQTGVIDSDYRGTWKAIIRFHGPMETNGFVERWEINPGDRIAQAVLRPTVRRVWTPVDVLPETNRGSGGFGSTGR